MNPVVKKFLQKQIFKQKGAIGSAASVDFAYKALETRMKNLGLDINLIKTQKDLDQALGFVTNMENQIFAKKFGDVLKPDAEIIPITDPKKRLDPKKPIMGGTQDEKEMLQKSIDKNIKEATEKGDLTGIKNQILRDPDIAREFMLSKKFPFSRDTNVLSGEDAIPLARKAKFDEEIGIKSVAPRDYSVEKLISDFKKFGNATDKDIQMILGSGKSGQIPYVMDNYGMSYTDVINTLKRGDPLIEGLATGGRAGFRVGKKVIEKIVKPKKTLKSIEETGMIDISDPDIAEEFAKFMKQMDPEGSAKIQKIVDDINQKIELKNFKTKDRKENSDGGRIGLKVGSPSKRAFLKVMGGLAATLAAIKSGLIGTGGKEVTKQVVKESAKDVANAPPKYFFDLANKIKLFGKESKVKPQERVNEYNYTGKNGDQYTLTEDIGTGDMQITKDKMGIGTVDEKSFDTINDRSIMEYRAPRKDVDPDSEKFLKEGAEYDEYKVEFDMDGTMGDGDVISENIKKEIIQEASDIPERKIKRAGGGVAYMLGE
jgi:mRNA-degrading endonuclease RelE of RelBE toxin-antitoxin system